MAGFMSFRPSPHLPLVDENSRHSTMKWCSHFMTRCIVTYKPAPQKKERVVTSCSGSLCGAWNPRTTSFKRHIYDTSWIDALASNTDPGSVTPGGTPLCQCVCSTANSVSVYKVPRTQNWQSIVGSNSTNPVKPWLHILIVLRYISETMWGHWDYML